MQKTTFALLGSLILLGTAGQPGFAQDEGTQLQTLLGKVAPSIVTVKLVLKMEYKFDGRSQDSESRMEMSGVVVDRDGLIMVTNSPFSSDFYKTLFQGREGMTVKATPTDFKVVFDQEEKEYTAFLAATDTKLELAFLKIEDLGDKKLSPIDFSAASTPTVGQQVVCVSRLAKGYDYAPSFMTARIGGSILKPRKAWLLDGGVGDFGLPLFAVGGQTLGVLAKVDPTTSETGESGSFSTSLRMMTGSGAAMRSFLLPSALVNGVIGQAKQRAVTVAAERAKKKAEAPKKVEVPKKADTAKPEKKTKP